MKPNYTLFNNWQHWLDSLTPAYKKMVEEEEKSLIKFAKENLSQKSKVLEVGCGTGRLLYLTSQFVGEAVGLECEYREIKEAEEKNESKKIKFMYSNGARMPFPDNSFDLEICFFNTLGNQNERKFEVVQEMRVKNLNFGTI